MPAAGPADMDWVDFAVDEEVDLLAVSFVRTAEDLVPINERIRARGADIPLIAKIEKPQALEGTEAILDQATSGIMVARGDLGIELPIESMPSTQKRLIRLAGSRSKMACCRPRMLKRCGSRSTRRKSAPVRSRPIAPVSISHRYTQTATGRRRVMTRISAFPVSRRTTAESTPRCIAGAPGLSGS